MDLAAAASMPPGPAPDEGHLVNNFFGHAAQSAGTTIQVPAESSASPLAVAQVTAAAQVQAAAIVAAPAEQRGQRRWSVGSGGGAENTKWRTQVFRAILERQCVLESERGSACVTRETRKQRGVVGVRLEPQ